MQDVHQNYIHFRSFLYLNTRGHLALQFVSMMFLHIPKTSQDSNLQDGLYSFSVMSPMCIMSVGITPALRLTHAEDLRLSMAMIEGRVFWCTSFMHPDHTCNLQLLSTSSSQLPCWNSYFLGIASYISLIDLWPFLPINPHPSLNKPLSHYNPDIHCSIGYYLLSNYLSME